MNSNFVCCVLMESVPRFESKATLAGDEFVRHVEQSQRTLVRHWLLEWCDLVEDQAERAFGMNVTSEPGKPFDCLRREMRSVNLVNTINKLTLAKNRTKDHVWQ